MCSGFYMHNIYTLCLKSKKRFWTFCYLSQGYYCCDKTPWPNQPEEERVCLAYASTALFITEGGQNRSSSRAGSWRQELMQRPWQGAAYWFVPLGLFSLFSYRTQDHQPRCGPTHNRLGLPPQSLIKKMPYRLAYNPILWRHFLNCGSLLSDDFS